MVLVMVAKSPAKVRNLLPRKGRYWARVSVPEALRPIIGKRELTEPLGADLTIAKRKLPGAVARMLERLSAAREELDAERKPSMQAPRAEPRPEPWQPRQGALRRGACA